MIKSLEFFLCNVRTLNVHEMRTLNRCYLHPIGLRCCAKCFIIYNGIRENFHIKKYYESGTVGYNVWCKPCKNEYSQTLNDRFRLSPEHFIKSRFSGYRSRAKTQNIPFNITPEYLLHQWEAQNGLCFYTSEKMCFTTIREDRKSAHPLTPSVDKMNPVEGYVIGNVVWCLHEINMMKKDFNYDKFIERCQTILKVRNT